jgi:hypothetical protein
MRDSTNRRCAAVLVVLSLIAGATSQAFGAVVPRALLKTYFETGDVPTQEQFGTLIDSMVHGTVVDDRFLLGLRQYDPGSTFLPGDIKRFGIGDKAPAGPLGYVLPGSGGTIQMAPDFAGHFGFAALLFGDSTGQSYYGFMQLEMDPLSPTAAGPGIHVQYIGIESQPNTPVTMEVIPEPGTLGAVALAAGMMLRRKRSKLRH